MAWTLDQVLQECARNTFNTKNMIRSGGVYSGKGLDYATRFLSGINYAMAKICREKWAPTTTETVKADKGGRFGLSTLSKPCLRVRKVMVNGADVAYNLEPGNLVGVPYAEDATCTITYDFLPNDLTLADLDKPIPLDPVAVDPHVLSQYADYQFLSEDGTEYDSARAQVWLGLFNDSFTNIGKLDRPRRVRYNG